MPTTSSPPETAVAYDVTSEIAQLRQVVVHTPGREMELVYPERRLDLLFDDILYVGHARHEHALMCRLFEKIVGRPDAVLQITDLLAETFAHEDARHAFVEQAAEAERATNLQAFESELKKLSPEELHRFALTGESPLPLTANPLPNMMFTRDLAAVVGRHVILSHAATAARARESIIIHVILHHHPAFAPLRDRIITLPRGVTFEGGDLLVPNERCVLIGQSERTSFGGIMSIAQALFERTAVEDVVMINLPYERWCMHLDTVFTFASEEECVVFPPLITDTSGKNNVVHLSKGGASGRFQLEVRENLHAALAHVLGRDLTFIPCGGSDALSQRREQWTDGANLFAVAPGVVVGYERNGRTFDVMREHGYRVVSIESFLSYYEEMDFTATGQKVAIKLEGTELSRGRGGPRCMTLPLARERTSPSA